MMAAQNPELYLYNIICCIMSFFLRSTKKSGLHKEERKK
jgi:hypothetical protein